MGEGSIAVCLWGDIVAPRLGHGPGDAQRQRTHANRQHCGGPGETKPPALLAFGSIDAVAMYINLSKVECN